MLLRRWSSALAGTPSRNPIADVYARWITAVTATVSSREPWPPCVSEPQEEGPMEHGFGLLRLPVGPAALATSSADSQPTVRRTITAWSFAVQQLPRRYSSSSGPQLSGQPSHTSAGLAGERAAGGPPLPPASDSDPAEFPRAGAGGSCLDAGMAVTFLGQQRRDNCEAVGYRVAGRAGGAQGEGEGEGEGPAVPLEVAQQEAFAVVQVGSHQFKVTPGDVIYTEKLNFANINDILHLHRVLLLGTPSSSLIGRPTLPDCHVAALVEEHALDAKVIVFKKKRRKNYRRTRGHRQELTRLRILEVVGGQGAEAGGEAVGGTVQLKVAAAASA